LAESYTLVVWHCLHVILRAWQYHSIMAPVWH